MAPRTVANITPFVGHIAQNPSIVFKQHTLVLGYIFLALPLFDMVNGFLVVRGFLPEGSVGSPSQIGRFLATMILLYVNFWTRFPAICIVVLVWLLLIETVAGFHHNQVAGVLFGYVSISKFVYMYLLFITLVRYVQDHRAPLARYLKYNLNFINGSIVFAFHTGLANSTYGWGSGIKGFFASGNGLGIYIGVATIVLLAMRRYGYYERVGTPTFVLALIALLLIGTKTSFLLASIALVLILWESRARFLMIPLFVLSVIYAWEKTVAQVIIFFDIIIIRYKNSESLLEYLSSNRDNYVTGAFTQVYQQDIGVLRWMTGAGSFISFQDPNWAAFFDTLETDLFDVLFMYGMIGVIGYVAFIAYGIKLLLRHPYFLLSMGLLSLHSMLAGHVLFNGMSSTLLIIVVAIGVLIRTNSFHRPRTEVFPNGGKS